MTTKVNTKVRLVRCPRCRLVLAELPGVVLYKCGGCDITLQAKNRKVENNQTELSSQEKDSAAKNQQDNVLEEKEEARSSNHELIGPPTAQSSPDKSIGCEKEEARSSNHELIGPPTAQSSPDKSIGCEKEEARSSNHDLIGPPTVQSSPDKSIGCLSEHGDSGMEHCEDKSVKEGTSGSPEVTSLRNEDSPVEDAASLKHDNHSGQISERYHRKFHDDHGEWTGGRNSSSEFSSSSELTHDAGVYNSEAGEQVEQDDGLDQMECRESKRVRQDDDNFVDEVKNLPEHENEESVVPPDGEQQEGIKNNYLPPVNDEKSRVSFTDQSGDFDGGNKRAGDSSSGIVYREDDSISKSAEQNTVVDDGTEGLPTFRSSSTERNMNASVFDSIDDPQSPMNESHVSFYLTSPDDEHLDHALREGTRNFERFSSIDTFGSSSFADLSSELNSKHPSMMNYPTTRSYDAYDGSESSCDGTDDQIRERILRPSRKSKDVDYIRTTELLRKDGFRVNNVVSSEPERPYWATSSSHHATKSSNRSQDKSIDTNRYASGNRTRLDKQGAGSRVPFTSRDPLPGHRTVGISSYQHDMLPPRPGFNSSHKPSHSEADNIDLLRTVWELKDQLNRMQLPKVTTNRRFPSGVVNGKFTPYQYDHLATEREMFEDHPAGYNPRFNQARGYAGRFNVSRLSFSGAAHHRHQLSCSCLHCCPEDWHYSAQLPSCSVHHENGHCLVHNDHNCRNVSSSSSPQHYTSSELSVRGCQTKSDNQRPNELARLPLKEKYHTAKRHLRPIAGGAPVIACYYCSEVLQLPVDFLLFKKRYHRLMCNACKKVLKFSLLKGTHIVPYLPDASAPPPPSEVDDNNDATSRRNLDPLSHSSSQQNAEPVSCSDDYGPSFRGSYSTEGEASVILPSFAHSKRNSYDRKMSSGSSYEPKEDGKMKSILREPQNKNESSLKNVESVGPSSEMPKWRKTTSEIEELPTSSNSPLHRLMGYSSPSHVLNK